VSAVNFLFGDYIQIVMNFTGIKFKTPTAQISEFKIVLRSTYTLSYSSGAIRHLFQKDY